MSSLKNKWLIGGIVAVIVVVFAGVWHYNSTAITPALNDKVYVMNLSDEKIYMKFEKSHKLLAGEELSDLSSDSDSDASWKYDDKRLTITLDDSSLHIDGIRRDGNNLVGAISHDGVSFNVRLQRIGK